jgi:hypothetical protein
MHDESSRVRGGCLADVYRSRPPSRTSDVEMRAFLALGSLAVAKADLIGNYGPRIPDHGPHVVIDEGARGLFFLVRAGQSTTPQRLLLTTAARRGRQDARRGSTGATPAPS